MTKDLLNKWELKWLNRMKERWTSRFLDRVLPWLTHLGSHFGVLLFMILFWVITKKSRMLVYLLLLYAILCGIVYSLKYLVYRRRRPLSILDIADKISKGPGEVLDPSFPSAHTAFAFMMAALLSAWFPQLRILFFLMAGFIGWTRMYLGLHYPTDVFAGGLLGYGITKIFLSYSLLTLSPHS